MAWKSIALLAVLLQSSIATALDDSWLIQKGRIGQIRIGMTVDEFYTVVGVDHTSLVDQHTEGTFSPALLVRQKDSEPVSLIAEVECGEHRWLIGRLKLNDQRFHTASGLHVGSNFGDIKKAYPNSELLSGEGQVFARVATLGISFGLSAKPRNSADGVPVVTTILLTN
jgi:hypothetical protein